MELQTVVTSFFDLMAIVCGALLAYGGWLCLLYVLHADDGGRPENPLQRDPGPHAAAAATSCEREMPAMKRFLNRRAGQIDATAWSQRSGGR